jgi:hypothetical protein
MRIGQIIIPIFILLLALLQGQSVAIDVVWTEGHHEIGNGKEYDWISNLWTYNDVTVTTYLGGGVGYFRMYDNSKLTNLYGGVNYLYLYENTMASVFRSDNPLNIWIDPSSTALVSLYAYDVTFHPLNPPFEPYSEGWFEGRWLANDNFFHIDLTGEGAYSKVQIVPEPATFILLGLGALAALKRRRR